MKSPLEVARWLADRLDEDSLPYALGGALALAAWAGPRQTVDVDIAVFVGEEALARVVDAVERAGAVVNRDDAERSVASTGMFIAQLARTRIDVFLATHPAHEEMGRRRRPVEVEGTRLWFLSPEDLALLKLIYGRPKDLVDLERLFAARADLDVAYIRSWLERIVPPADARLDTLADLARRFPPPLTPAIRDAVREVVDVLAAGRCDQLVSDRRAGRLTAEQLERAVREYGRTLVALPEEVWALVQVYRLEDGSGVVLEVPLWTTEEGRSDLTLSLTAYDRDGAVAIEIDDLHVL
jgi:hypothetical protein